MGRGRLKKQPRNAVTTTHELSRTRRRIETVQWLPFPAAPLLLNDGSRQSWTLPAGNYEVDVKVAAAQNGRDGVTVTWLGSDCPNQTEKQLHHIQGHVADTSALTVENPTVFGAGSAVNGYIKIVRVP